MLFEVFFNEEDTLLFIALERGKDVAGKIQNVYIKLLFNALVNFNCSALRKFSMN